MDLKAPLEYGKSPKITDEQVQRLENGTDSVNSMQSKTKRCNAKYENNPRRRFPKNSEHEQSPAIDLKIDNLDRVSIPTKIVATFDFAHPILGTTYGV